MRFLKKFKGRDAPTPRTNTSVLQEEPQSAAFDQPITFTTLPMASPTIVSRSHEGAGRTRLIGFDSSSAPAEPDTPATLHDGPAPSFMPVGWLVVTSELGRGQCFALAAGLSTIGRAEDQTVCLDFGDRAISRNNHAAIVYDPDTNTFLLGHGGKANLVRLNGSPVTSTVPLESGADIQIGDTRLFFRALCDGAFNWEETDQKDNGNAAQL